MPRGNGQVERYNQTILNSLATMGANLDGDSWDDSLSEALIGFRVVSQGLLEPDGVVSAVDVVTDIPGMNRSRLRYNSTAGVDNMRPWVKYDR